MSKLPTPLRIGTRASKLALRQAALVQQALLEADPALAVPGRIEIVPLQSAGDWKHGQQERSFAMMGVNKGLFARELEQALHEKQIDLAVHSAKDLETTLAPGLVLSAFLPRGDVRDAFICAGAAHPRDLPEGARVGTASLRRAVQLLHMRPDLVISPLRGNVDTRLRKVQEGQVDATLLALCGLQRLEIPASQYHALPTADILPAVAQAAIAVESREKDAALLAVLAKINCPLTAQCVTLERLFLHHLNGSCHTPVAALATRRDDGRIDFTALIAQPNGENRTVRQLTLTAGGGAGQVAALGEELRALLPAGLFI